MRKMPTGPAPPQGRQTRIHVKIQGSMELRTQLLSRMARCTAEHQVPGMFLASVLSSAGTRGAEVAAQARQQLRESGSLVESYRYPVSWMLGMLDVIGQCAEQQGESYGEALYRVGQEAGEAYVQSTVGKVRAMVAAASGLHRTLEGIPGAASQAVNFGEHSYRRLSVSSGELAFRQDLIGVSWNTGMVVASTCAALSLKVETLKVAVHQTDPDASSFLLRLEW